MKYYILFFLSVATFSFSQKLKEAEIGWLSGNSIRKNFTAVELGFFIHQNGYEFTREWLDNEE